MESGFDWSALAMSGNSLSLFGARRILELRIPSGKPGTEGAEAIKRYVADLPPDTVTLVLAAQARQSHACNSGWFEALDAAGVAVAANPVPPDRLPQWLAGRLAAAGPASRPGHAAVPGGHGGRQPARRSAGGAEARAAVSARKADPARRWNRPSRTWRATTCSSSARRCCRGIGARFVRMLEGLKGEGVAPPLVLWAIAEEMRALLRVSTAVSQRQPLQAAMREARVWGARAELLPRALRRVQAAELRGGTAARGGCRSHDQRAGAGRRLGGTAAARAAPGCRAIAVRIDRS